MFRKPWLTACALLVFGATRDPDRAQGAGKNGAQGVATRANLSKVLLALGRGEEALAEARREPDEGYRLWALAILHHGLGHGTESDAALQELIEKHAADSAYQVAEVYGARGETEQAFDWLYRAYAQRDAGLTTGAVNSPHLRFLHGDRRWGAFLKKMGLED